MGEVWKAVADGITEREVAIKVVRTGAGKGYLEALATEARTLAKTPHHHNMVSLYDVLELSDQLALVMEYIPGATLSTLIANHPSGLPWDLACLVFQGLFDGVGHAHKNRVIHRDLKPDNVRIANFEPEKPFGAHDIKILDFGLARAEKQYGTQFTRSAAGTLTYMSPEQLKEEPQGTYTDVYALGIILYEALTGKPPFGGPGQDSFRALIQAHCELPPPAPGLSRQGVSGSLEQALLRALAKNPEQRFQTAEEMGRAVLPLLQRNANDPTIGKVNKHQETIDLNALPGGTILDPKFFRNVGSGSRAIPSSSNAVRPTAGLLTTPPSPFRRFLKWGCGGCLGLFLLSGGFTYVMNWTSQRSSREAQVAKAKLPELCEIKGGAFSTVNYPAGKVDTFQLAKTPVTVEQFRAFVKATAYKAGQAWDRKGNDNHPVTSVSYEDAVAYAAWLSRITGDTWYIPSEADYEFAASNRGQKIAYPWGNDMPSPQTPMANSGRIATVLDSVPTTEVGTFPANDLGLKDMIGNVWTWTSTKTSDGLYKVKGGSWEDAPGLIKITNFAKKPANLRHEKYGFRVAKR